ncbi:hypothetical protein ACHAXS_002439 [Conticribra weissflogii]
MIPPNTIALIRSLLVMLVASPAHAALEVIGSGYGRTGTDTLREALNELGYKTYHMREIFQGQLISDVHLWHAQAENNCAVVHALRELFERGGWTAAVDFPASMCYESLMKAFPNAKVIHTKRKSAEQWWDSAINSIMVVGKTFPFNIIHKTVPFFKAHKSMCDAMWGNVLGGKKVTIHDVDFPHGYKEEFISAYEANNAKVKKAVPKKKLLVHDHSKGWTELCKFLGKEVPAIPYPHSNKREDFFKGVLILSLQMIFGVLTALAMFLYSLKKLIGLFSRNEKNKVE